jgi:hypothetical protein
MYHPMLCTETPKTNARKMFRDHVHTDFKYLNGTGIPFMDHLE